MAEREFLLEARNLCATVQGHPVLAGVNLVVRPGEVHAVMGPNGSGKSTLAQVLAGRPGYEVTGGSVRFGGQDLLAMAPEQRALAGLFLAFQYPVELPGVGNAYFLKAAVNAKRAHDGREPLDAVDFLAALRGEMAALRMDPALVERAVNEGFSGGEKKRNEILQMAMLEPSLAILDETDSGLDIDALGVVAEAVNRMRAPGRSMVLVTHWQRLLAHIVPDVVHILAKGRIVRTGGPELALALERQGYALLDEPPARSGAAARPARQAATAP